jgi:CRP-like cAMP-binding protein
VETTYDLLREQGFLAGLTDWQLERLARRAHRTVVPTGGRLCREGGGADRLWIIVSGEVTVDAAGAPIERLGPGAVVGWSSLVPPYRWHFGATTTRTTVMVEIDGPVLREMCEQDPILGYHVERSLTTVIARRLEAQRGAR